MQKLVWQNANGLEIDLTSGNYGITEWQGFSNTSLNIQQQQVPFQDGGVFLDALMEQRELSVTLAIQDNNNLETRYEKRRELISALNPKLGEGYLIYTNDFISKRIKCIPQIPLFENHNSNDSGTPKASLAWTACEPYWEDLGLQSYNIEVDEIVEIENKGDLPVQVLVNLITKDSVNPAIENDTTGEKIELDGTFNGGIEINTKVGEKTIESYSETELKNYLEYYFSLTGAPFNYSEITGKYYLGASILPYATSNNILQSEDLKRWEYCKFVGGTYGRGKCADSQLLNKFLFLALRAVGSVSPFGGVLYSTSDGENWSEYNFGNEGSQPIEGYRTFCESANLLVFMGFDKIKTTADGTNWNTITVPNADNDVIYNAIYISTLSLYIGVGDGGQHRSVIHTSTDGVNWARTLDIQNMGTLFDIAYSDTLNMIVIVGEGGTLTSTDGSNWTKHDLDIIFGCIKWVSEKSQFIAICTRESQGDFAEFSTSTDGINWVRNKGGPEQADALIYSSGLSSYVITGRNIVAKSKFGKNWEYYIDQSIADNLEIYISCAYSELFDTYAVCSDNGKIFISKNLKDWAIYENIMSNPKKLFWCEELALYVLIGNGGNIKTSKNGKDWIQQSSGVTTNLNAITYDSKYGLVIVGNTGTILNSQDGTKWERITPTVQSSINFNDVVIAEGSMVIVCDGGKIIIGEYNNGTWVFYNSNATGTSENLNCIDYNQNTKIAVVAGNHSTVLTANGNFYTWTTQIAPTIPDVSGTLKFTEVFYDKLRDIFLLVSGPYTDPTTGVFKSVDGESWELIQDLLFLSTTSFALNTKDGSLLSVGDYNIKKSNPLTFENIVSKLSVESNLNFNLARGLNKIKLNEDSGELYATISFRQKYIGV